MARLKALPSLDIIHGFRGVIDFYMWRGIPCARAWPRFRPANWGAPSRASAALFGLVIKAWAETGPFPKQLYAEEAADNPRTSRDVYVSAVHGHLHEASMSDFLDLLTECRDFLSDLTALLNALDSIDTDELVVNVDQSALPAGAATAAHQVTQTTALQKIDDLQDALRSVATDRLMVKGEAMLQNYAGVLADETAGAVSGAGGHLDTGVVPGNTHWRITAVTARDATSATTTIQLLLNHNGNFRVFNDDVRAIPANEHSEWNGEIYADTGDFIRAVFVGSLAGDTCVIDVFGHDITPE